MPPKRADGVAVNEPAASGVDQTVRAPTAAAVAALLLAAPAVAEGHDSEQRCDADCGTAAAGGLIVGFAPAFLSLALDAEITVRLALGSPLPPGLRAGLWLGLIDVALGFAVLSLDGPWFVTLPLIGLGGITAVLGSLVEPGSNTGVGPRG